MIYQIFPLLPLAEGQTKKKQVDTGNFKNNFWKMFCFSTYLGLLNLYLPTKRKLFYAFFVALSLSLTSMISSHILHILLSFLYYSELQIIYTSSFFCPGGWIAINLSFSLPVMSSHLCIPHSNMVQGLW